VGIVYSGAPPDVARPDPPGRPAASIIIRTFNEARYLEEVLERVACQKLSLPGSIEVIVVDSGSTDGTLEIAHKHGAVIRNIPKPDFTFGRSLNLGCEAAKAPLLVLLSGHCIPFQEHWLDDLLKPFADPHVGATYGRQVTNENAKFSEGRVFAKYYPDGPPSQAPAFCNNANAAVRKSLWRRFRYDESLTGLEDMDFGKKIVAAGFEIRYASGAAVFHIHHETWAQVRRRYEREAIALRHIFPHIHLNFFEAAFCFFSAVRGDLTEAARFGKLPALLVEIIRYRWNQFLGSYKGSRPHRELSAKEKARYFFPG
jgi:rhamnosyltransferase